MDETPTNYVGSDVFISYKREERHRVEPIAERLRSLGLTVWLDAALEAGTTFDEVIARELKLAKTQLVAWSKASVDSEWVRAEATLGRARGVLVPVFLEACDPPPPFNIQETVDLTSWPSSLARDGWARILARVGKLIGRGAALERWDIARIENDARLFRAFANEFSKDPLAQLARRAAYHLELDDARTRLVRELQIADESIDDSLDHKGDVRGRELVDAERGMRLEAERKLSDATRTQKAELASLSAQLSNVSAELKAVQDELDARRRTDQHLVSDIDRQAQSEVKELRELVDRQKHDLLLADIKWHVEDDRAARHEHEALKSQRQLRDTQEAFERTKGELATAVLNERILREAVGPNTATAVLRVEQTRKRDFFVASALSVPMLICLVLFESIVADKNSIYWSFRIPLYWTYAIFAGIGAGVGLWHPSYQVLLAQGIATAAVVILNPTTFPMSWTEMAFCAIVPTVVAATTYAALRWSSRRRSS